MVNKKLFFNQCLQIIPVKLQLMIFRNKFMEILVVFKKSFMNSNNNNQHKQLLLQVDKELKA